VGAYLGWFIHTILFVADTRCRDDIVAARRGGGAPAG
jgi:hypothetical protein